MDRGFRSFFLDGRGHHAGGKCNHLFTQYRVFTLNFGQLDVFVHASAFSAIALYFSCASDRSDINFSSFCCSSPLRRFSLFSSVCAEVNCVETSL